MLHIPKQSHYVRYPALKLMCSSLCGPLTKKFRGTALIPEALVAISSHELSQACPLQVICL